MSNTKSGKDRSSIGRSYLSFPNSNIGSTTAGIDIGYHGPPPDTPFSNPPDDAYLNPIGFGMMRNDQAGFGYWGALREKNRKHKAIDIRSTVGQPVYAPFDGWANKTTNKKYEGVDIEDKKNLGRILYITPTEEIVNAEGKIKVKKGDVIGYAQDTSIIYKPSNNNNNDKMENHIHFELY